MSTELENLVEIDLLLEDAKLRANAMMDHEPNSRERARAAVDIHQILSEAFRLHKIHGTTEDQRDKLRELANTVIESGFGLHHGAYPSTSDSTTPAPDLSGVVSRGEALSGTEGQDRESYTDDQDRDNYSDPTDPESNLIGAAKAGRLDEWDPNLDEWLVDTHPYVKNKDGFIHEEVHLDLNEAVERDLEGFIDLLSTLAIGDDLLMDVSWKVIGVTDENLIRVIVSGDPSASEEVRSGR